MSGTYYLHPGPGGGEDIEVYCDQERDGGGWILIGAVNPATTDGVSERATWFQNGNWPWTALLTNEFNTNGVPAAFSARVWMDYALTDQSLARFEFFEGDDLSNTVTWYKRIERDHFESWIGETVPPTLQCTNLEMTQNCVMRGSNGDVGQLLFNMQFLVNGVPTGNFHMRPDGTPSNAPSGVCSGSDLPQWTNSNYQGRFSNWGHGLKIWLKL